MFKDCTSLTTVESIKATTLAKLCYEEMFSGCIGLREIGTIICEQ